MLCIGNLKIKEPRLYCIIGGWKMAEELWQERSSEVAGKILCPQETHVAWVFLLDTSSKMTGPSIKSLNKELNDFIAQISSDEIASKTLDVAIIQFSDDYCLVQDFTPVSMMEPVELSAYGCCAMGGAINFAIDKVKGRVRLYNDMGTPYYQPFIFLITSGAPTDDITAAAERIKIEENKGEFGKLKFWAVGIPGADFEFLKTLSRRVIKLEDMFLGEIFKTDVRKKCLVIL